MSKSEWQSIGENIALFRQKTSKFWWCRLKIDGEEYRFSTKQTDKMKATEVAYEQKIYAKRNPEDCILFSRNYTFDKVAKRAIKHLKEEEVQKPIYKQYIDRIENHISPHFAKKPINKINQKELKDYFVLKKLVSQTTINTEKRAFRIVFEYATMTNCAKEYEIPDFPKITRKKRQKRKRFTKEQLKILTDNIFSFINDTKNKKSKAMRENMGLQMMFLANTGLRVGDEIEDIQGKHLITKEGKPFVTITSGKVQSPDNPRDVPLNSIALSVVRQIITNHKEKSMEVITDNNGVTSIKKISDKELEEFYPFRFEGQKSTSSKRFNQYKKWLKEKGMYEFTDKHTLYSFRHSYITDQLLNTNLPHAVVASMVGSSLVMIDQHYNDIIAEMKQDEFRSYENNLGIELS